VNTAKESKTEEPVKKNPKRQGRVGFLGSQPSLSRL